ncbi:MAG: hypothetical protein IH840_12410 [Candidatus Heimdallarchaeota archaeon]|nr:hypothetical protein [Candidatus Heimdallarchaeota archaeon]
MVSLLAFIASFGKFWGAGFIAKEGIATCDVIIAAFQAYIGGVNFFTDEINILNFPNLMIGAVGALLTLLSYKFIMLRSNKLFYNRLYLK